MKKKWFIIWDVIYPLVFFLLCLAVVTIAVIIVGGLAAGSMSSDVILSRFPVLSIVVNLGFYSITILTQWKVYKKDDIRFGERKNRWSVLRLILAVAAALGISIVLNLVIMMSPLPDIFPSYTESAEQSFAGQPWFILILAVVIIGPIAEELIFRGLIYDRLRHYVSFPLAVIISSLMFGIYHGNMIQFIYSTLMGCLLAVYYEKSGGLLVCVLAHMAMNASAVVSFF